LKERNVKPVGFYIVQIEIDHKPIQDELPMDKSTIKLKIRIHVASK